MKKELIISNYDDIWNPYYSGGGARAIHEVARLLAASFDITVITGKYPGSKNRKIDNVNYMHAGISFGGPKLGQLFYQLSLIVLVRRVKYDIWIENFTPPFSTSFLPLFTKKPVIGLAHMLCASEMKRKYKLPFHIIENLGLKKYRHIIVTQESIKRYIEKIGSKSKIIIIPNGVTLPKLRSYTKPKHILYLGRIEVNQKGIDLLLDAFERLNNEDIKLLIAGSGESKQVRILKKLISKNKMKNIIQYVGRVEGQTKEKMINSSYCVVVPSRYETFSMVSLEAMVQKKPVISFDIPGLKWLPDNSGIKIQPYNTEKMSRAIEKIIDNQTLRNSLGLKGYEYAKKLDWTFIANEYHQLLQKII